MIAALGRGFRNNPATVNAGRANVCFVRIRNERDRLNPEGYG